MLKSGRDRPLFFICPTKFGSNIYPALFSYPAPACFLRFWQPKIYHFLSKIFVIFPLFYRNQRTSYYFKKNGKEIPKTCLIGFSFFQILLHASAHPWQLPVFLHGLRTEGIFRKYNRGYYPIFIPSFPCLKYYHVFKFSQYKTNITRLLTFV